MKALEVGRKLVEMVNAGPESEAAFVAEYYADDIVSIEGGEDSPEAPQRLEGLDAVRGKHAWWFDNHEIHSSEALGAYYGHRDDQFVVRFRHDVTPHGGERMQIDEVGVYTLAGGKIVQEEFLYLMG